jgi:hypothetical protein
MAEQLTRAGVITGREDLPCLTSVYEAAITRRVLGVVENSACELRTCSDVSHIRNTKDLVCAHVLEMKRFMALLVRAIRRIHRSRFSFLPLAALLVPHAALVRFVHRSENSSTAAQPSHCEYIEDALVLYLRKCMILGTGGPSGSQPSAAERSYLAGALLAFVLPAVTPAMFGKLRAEIQAHT